MTTSGFVGFLLGELADPADGFGQAFGAHGLEQVVNGGQLEGLQGLVLVGGDEDDGRGTGEAGNHPGDVQPGERGHVDVQEERVDLELLHGLQRLGPGVGAVDGAHPRIERQQEGQLLNGRQFVVGDDHINHG